MYVGIYVQIFGKAMYTFAVLSLYVCIYMHTHTYKTAFQAHIHAIHTDTDGEL